MSSNYPIRKKFALAARGNILNGQRQTTIGNAAQYFRNANKPDLARMNALQKAVNELENLYYNTHGLFERIDLKKRISAAKQDLTDLQQSVIRNMQQRQFTKIRNGTS